jgi:cytoskeletal protein RodZ
MSTVAEKLRQARESQNLTVHQVAEITKIRTDHIRALEQGDFNVFSAPVYIRGFVRTYATLLKLDVPQTMAALDAELGRTDKFSEPPPLTEPKRGPLDFVMLQLSKVNWRKGLIGLAALLGVVILASAFLTWRHCRTRDPLKGLKPGVYQTKPGGAGETLPVPAPTPKK